MGVYIKDMEMPEDRETVTITICADGLVFEEFKEPGDVFHAVPVPAHGRLIDADALKVQDGWLRDSKYFSQASSHTHITFVYSNDICNAPTIIEAEEVEA